jgi:Tol biopolymer transport system component
VIAMPHPEPSSRSLAQRDASRTTAIGSTGARRSRPPRSESLAGRRGHKVLARAISRSMQQLQPPKEGTAMPSRRRGISNYRVLTLSAMAASLGLAFAAPAQATYPGRNGLIAFSGGDPDGSAQIWTVDSHGRGLRQLTHLNGDALNQDWSPDGRMMVFELNASDGDSIQLMRADGTHLHALTPPTACCNGDPSFTPDGRRIVFSSFNPDTHDEAIYSIKIDGSDQRRITAGPHGATDPNVSPDGRTLTFRSGAGLEDENGALFRTSISGGPIAQITPFAFVSIKHDWAPDGRRLVYSDGADTGDPTVSVNIATVDPDGSHIRHLTNYRGGAVSAFPGSYSPNGRKIVLRLENHDKFWLYEMRTDGSHLRPIVSLGTMKPRLTDWGSSGSSARPRSDSITLSRTRPW